ncbi:PepSY-associated TM helix domain-containing protein [Undibacterium arcticum]
MRFLGQKKLHSRLQQGDGWRWMIELAASWLMVMLVTGIALWWPRAHQKAWPQPGASGRNKWKQWHGFIGVVLGLMTATVLITGLTWSKYAGDQVRALRDHIGQTPPQVPRSLQSAAVPGAASISWQSAWDRARALAPDVRLQLTAPATEHGVWRVTAADTSQPTKRFDLILDGYNGAALYYADWRKQTVFAQATAIGIPFHRGEFGWWNQALLLLFALGVVFSILSGWVMVFQTSPGRRVTSTADGGAVVAALVAGCLEVGLAAGMCHCGADVRRDAAAGGIGGAADHRRMRTGAATEIRQQR